MAGLPFAVIGAGQIGMRHIEVAQNLPQVDLVGVVEPDAARRAHLADQGLQMFADVSDLPQAVQAAVVATPTPQHFAAASAALDRDLAVLVEKPIAGTLDEARHLAQRAQDRDLPLFTGHHRRCHAFCSAARNQIVGMGQIIGVQGFWSLRKHDSYYDVPWRCAPGAGPLMTNLSHEIDLLHFLLGPIADVSTMLSHRARGLAVEDTAVINLRFESGALGSFLISDAGASPWAFEAATGENPEIAASGEDYIRITGSAGAVGFPSLTAWDRPEGPPDWKHPLTRTEAPRFEPVDPLREQMRRFATVAGGGQDNVLCTAEAGIAALEITLAAALSGQTGSPVRAGDVPGTYTGA